MSSSKNHRNKNSVEPLHSQVTVSYIGQGTNRSLEYDPSTYSNTPEVPNNQKYPETNQKNNKDSQSNDTKICTSAKLVFFLFGVILCGIPLIVFTMLWVNQRSTSSSNAASVSMSTASNLTTTLPVQCYSYVTLSDTFRNYNNFWSCCPSPPDTASTLPSGWYRIMGLAGTTLLTTPVLSTGNCGSSFPGYFNGTLPSTPGALVTGTVCFYTGTPCGYSLSPISVINCGGYYVFFLISVINSSYKYCTTI